MEAKLETPKASWKLPVLVLGVFLFIGLVYLRRTADGIRNALSPNYWRERSAGFDLYNPREHYFKRGSRSHHDLLLTFDDAPHASSILQILAALKQQHVPAVFFVIGRNIKKNPGLLRSIWTNGHEIGNHTQDHVRLDQLTPKQIRAEITNCEINVQRAIGRKMTLLRPPGMRLTPTINSEISALGYTVVGWNVGAKDFIPDLQVTDMTAEESANLRATPDQITQRVVGQAKDGEIILLHDNPVTAQALPAMIGELKREGFQFVTAAQMLAELPHPVTIVANPPSDPKTSLRH